MGYFLNFEKMEYVSGKRPEGCILCNVRDKHKDIIDLTFYEDELFLLTVNLYPYNPGHSMIVPKRHVIDIRELTKQENERFPVLRDNLITAMEKVYNPQGFNLGYNMGLDSGASIDHLHFHVVPRFPREVGFADIIAGQRVMVESPVDSAKHLKAAFSAPPLYTEPAE